jgi:hypothetical protein
MAPVTASTNKDNPKIVLAGVDSGVKIFVGLKGWDVPAKAATGPQIQTRSGDSNTRQLLEPRDRNESPSFSGSLNRRESTVRHCLCRLERFVTVAGLCLDELDIDQVFAKEPRLQFIASQHLCASAWAFSLNVCKTPAKLRLSWRSSGSH